jgi:histidine ammonia-lyase
MERRDSRASAAPQTVTLDGERLSIEDVVAVARGAEVRISHDAVQRAERSRKALEAILESGEAVYGVNTGFGPLKSEIIPPEHQLELQENLVRSHAMGVGDPLPREVVRAAMLLVAATHLRGYSGVDARIAQHLCERLNTNDLPSVPEMGSLGASGDLAPLAHVALEILNGGFSLREKEGLSLINGTHVHTGIAALLIPEAEMLAKAADVACAMNLEAMLCSRQPFQERVHRLRPHPHQQRSAKNIARMIEGSELIQSHANCGEVQDAYSIRCAPQVHGAARNSIAHLREVVEIELNSVTDNPLVFEDAVLSAGHFHGEPVGLALDYAKIGLAELASISERRSDRCLNQATNRGLPPFLTGSPGLNSGMMICQYTAAALVSESKVLAHPSCVDSLTTGANQEDHVSMAMNAALHARRVATNTRIVLAIELVIAAQALDCRRRIQPEAPGAGVQAAWDSLREQIPPLDGDRSLSKEIQELDLARVVQAVEAAVGALE